MNSIYAVDKIYLMLGSACNLKCRHCYQADNPQPHLKKRIHPDVFAFLARIAAQRPDPVELVFWGGEPLLYWNLIREVVDRLGPVFKYGFISNGTLLTDEMVDYLNAHDILFSVSCDGPQTAKVRGVNILEDDAFCARFRRINRRCVGTTVHAYNIDPEALQSWLFERVGEVRIHYQYTLECTWDMDRDLYAYDFEKFEANLDRCAEAFARDFREGRDDTAAAYCFRRGVSAIRKYRSMDARGKPRYWWPECSSMRKTMNIGIDGTVHLCHNRDTPLGRVTDSYEALLEANDRMLREALSAKTECDACDVREWCRRGCPINSVSANPGQKECCRAERIYWLASLKAEKNVKKLYTRIAL